MTIIVTDGIQLLQLAKARHDETCSSSLAVETISASTKSVKYFKINLLKTAKVENRLLRTKSILALVLNKLIIIFIKNMY